MKFCNIKQKVLECLLAAVLSVVFRFSVKVILTQNDIWSVIAELKPSKTQLPDFSTLESRILQKYHLKGNIELHQVLKRQLNLYRNKVKKQPSHSIVYNC